MWLVNEEVIVIYVKMSQILGHDITMYTLSSKRYTDTYIYMVEPDNGT